MTFLLSFINYDIYKFEQNFFSWSNINGCFALKILQAIIEEKFDPIANKYHLNFRWRHFVKLSTVNSW